MGLTRTPGKYPREKFGFSAHTPGAYPEQVCQLSGTQFLADSTFIVDVLEGEDLALTLEMFLECKP